MTRKDDVQRCVDLAAMRLAERLEAVRLAHLSHLARYATREGTNDIA